MYVNAPEDNAQNQEIGTNQHEDSTCREERIPRKDLKLAVGAMGRKSKLPSGVMPYPSDQATAELAQMLGGIKEKLARKAAVDARVGGLIPGYPSNAHLYVMLHKPPQALCARSERTRFAGTRNTIYDILPPGTPSLPHVGRLDNATSGLLLLSDDGPLAHALLSKQEDEDGEEAEEEGVQKEYWVGVTPGRGVRFAQGAGPLDMDPILDQIRMPLQYSKHGEKRETSSAVVEMLDPKIARITLGLVEASEEPLASSSSRVENLEGEGEEEVFFKVIISEGKNRQVRRLCARAGLVVQHLHRVRFGPLVLGDLQEGCARNLTQEEVALCYQETMNWESDDVPRVLEVESLT